MNSTFLLNTLRNCTQTFYRGYAFKSDLKIKWVRPVKVPCILPEKSGDAGSLPPVDPKNFLAGFENAKELEQVDETIKTLFRLENNRRKCTSQIYKEMFVKEVQRHNLDWGSMEAKLAEMTAKIRRLQQSYAEHPRNSKMKVYLKELIDKRKKFLKYLRRWDYKRFEWILEKLDLIYKPPPNEFHWITRKDSLRKLTNIHCENIRNERLAAYRKILEDQQIDFLEKKIKNLEFIRKEQQECEISVTVTEDEIRNIKKQLQQLKNLREESKKREEEDDEGRNR